MHHQRTGPRAEYRQQEELRIKSSASLADRFKQLKSLTVDLAFYNPEGVTRTKVLGSERMSRKLHDALPGGKDPLRAALWTFPRPILSPRLAELQRDAFVIDDTERRTVDLTAHRDDFSLDDSTSNSNSTSTSVRTMHAAA